MAEWGENLGGVLQNRSESSNEADLFFGPSSTDTKSSWNEIMVLDRDITSIILAPENWNTQLHLIDIGIGPSGSEQVVHENLFYGGQDFALDGAEFELPLRASKGDRIAVRIQQDEDTNSEGVSFIGIHRHWDYLRPTKSKIYGVNTSNTRGTLISTPSGGGASGWVELSSSTNRVREVIVMFAVTESAVQNSAGDLPFELGIGSSGNEQALVSDYFVFSWISTNHVEPNVFHFPLEIPEGERLSMQLHGDIEHEIQVATMGIG